MLGSSESWEPQQAPRRWHSRASRGAVHSINAGHVASVHYCLVLFGGGSGGSQAESSGPEASASIRAAITKSDSCNPPDLPGGQRYVAKTPSQRELRVMSDFLCKDAYRVGECQGGAIVAKLEATLDAACRRVKFPIGNLGEVACTLFARERFDAASARNAGTLRERRHRSFTLWRSQFGCRTDSRVQILAGVPQQKPGYLRRSLNAKVEPCPSWDSTQILPPCISMMRLDMARLKPVPPFLRVMALSACWNS